MRRLLAVLLLPAAALPIRAQAQLADAARAAPRILMPGAPVGQAPGLILVGAGAATPALAAGAPPALVIPAAPAILAPAPMIVPAARAMTEEEAAPATPPSQAGLKALAASLAPAAEPDGTDSSAERARSLDSRFDGRLAPEASDWTGVSADFSRGPLAPGLPAVELGARSLIARLLPSLYRRAPLTAAYDRGENPSTGHTWTPERGHVVELAPVRADARGEVASAFGAPNSLRVQQKIERLMEFAHEYFHVLFDTGVRRQENHPPQSAYAAMTEGFAVSGEQLLIKRLLDEAPSLGLGPRDAMDLAAIAAARSRWLDVEDNHYTEGILAWRKAYERGGAAGLVELLSSLSARRMIATPRSDPAYQLALGEPELLAGYLGRDAASPARRGLEAFAKAAKGEALTEAETKDAAAAAKKAGPDGWRRLYERTLFADKRLKDPPAQASSGSWWDKKTEAPVSVEAAFALARLDPEAAAALARLLADTISSPGGAGRLFGRPGPNETLNAIAAGAEALPWDAAGRKSWDAGLMRWLTGAR
ncbi:MAG TPA: hypothetical protein VN915_00080 [Elusimicrobiota bacterium]|nr:hypothetical protein [Elusimicrobiota bacterium]